MLKGRRLRTRTKLSRYYMELRHREQKTQLPFPLMLGLKRTANRLLTKLFASRHMKEGSCIINTASLAAYQGNQNLLDYSSTKGAIVAFTRSLSQQLISRGIRVNAVAPGPVWTPLQPASTPAEKIAQLGSEVPLDRADEPYEIAPSYVFLASNDCASYITGQVVHPNGGSIVNA
ncbi:unnamed protein product [Cuscuta campestris]|uniref:Uncharacterized protein n=1 Tax=Cuscuta campestris TaxID=132261 RepID=A0A484MYJ4_9ASTE|nr:unnamed protein product [Cuscuta campestris]